MSDLKRRLERERQEQTGNAGRFLFHVLVLLKTCTEVVLYCRESTEEQVDSGNLDDQIAEARSALRALGVKVIHVFDTPEGESSNIHDDRSILKQAIAFAKKRGAILVALTRDRFIRSSKFDGSSETEAPSDDEYREFLRLADGVLLATIEHPDSTRARSKQTIRGQTAKGRKGGRPLSKEERNRRAVEMRLAGASHAEIAKAFDAPCRSTVQHWTKGVRKGVRKTNADQSSAETH